MKRKTSEYIILLLVSIHTLFYAYSSYSINKIVNTPELYKEFKQLIDSTSLQSLVGQMGYTLDELLVYSGQVILIIAIISGIMLVFYGLGFFFRKSIFYYISAVMMTLFAIVYMFSRIIILAIILLVMMYFTIKIASYIKIQARLDSLEKSINNESDKTIIDIEV